VAPEALDPLEQSKPRSLRQSPRGQVHSKEPLREPSSDANEDSRLTVRSACAAAEQRFSRSDGNPIHAWEAIRMCTHPDVTPMFLPAWCVAYLYKASQALLAAVEQSELHATLVSQALGFTRGGWSAGKDLASNAKATRAALLYDKFRLEGLSAATAYEEVRKHARLGDSDSARKLIRAGKRMLQHIPASALAAPPIRLNRQDTRLLNALMRTEEAAKQSVADAARSNRPRTPTQQPARRAKPRG
jgi:hypothetical protein